MLRAQAALARSHGVDGLVMYHYWFDGQRLLHAPLDNLLADRAIDLPFALCWANENWTRTWDGLEKDVLIAQTYTEGWADRFYDDLLPALRDPRYLRVGDKPLLVVYRVGQIPQAREVLEGWKRRALADGLGGLHLLGVIPSREFEGVEPAAAAALDGLVRFPPGSGVGLQQLQPQGYVQGTDRCRLLLRGSRRARRPQHPQRPRSSHPPGGHAGLGQHRPAGYGVVLLPRRQPAHLPPVARPRP